MKPAERLKNYPVHESMRGYFQHELYKEMTKNKNIWLIAVDLGYRMFDSHFEDFPDRCINPGAAEQSAMGIAVGLALSGKIPVVYTITPFLLYRPFEVVRNYIHHEGIPVKLVGSGRDKDYEHDGYTHWAEEDDRVMKIFWNIKPYWPDDKEEMKTLVPEIINNGMPVYLNLKRG